MDQLWQAFILSPLARAGAVGIIVPMIVQVLKGYLPTGHDANDPTKPTENRWIPAIVVLLNLGLNIGGAFYTGQSPVESGFYGVIAGLVAVGGVRLWNLSTQGDKTERQRAAAVVKAENMERKADVLAGQVVQADRAVETMAGALVAAQPPEPTPG